MYKGLRVAAIVPAFNEEQLILETLTGIPDSVDRVFVIDDGSSDRTAELTEERASSDPRIELIRHEKNRGLGQSLIDGYVASRDSDADVTVVMAGDNQMHPGDLPGLLDPIADDGFDYVKGNRLLHKGIGSMPRYRFFGNAILTILTKFATGYYSLMDPQCGYTALRNSALSRIPIEEMTRGYGYNADILCMLNIMRMKVTDAEVRPVYGSAKSGINLWSYVPRTIWLLIRLFFRRLWRRYVVLDFHPLVLFYMFAMFNTVFLIIPFTVRFFTRFIQNGQVPQTTLAILVFTVLMTFQSILFAIWMDMDYNKPGKR